MVVMEIVNRESDLEEFSEKELKEYKHWLFKESVRINTERKELKSQKERLSRENMLFDKRLQILQDGFRELDQDRKKLEREWTRLKREKEMLEEDMAFGLIDGQGLVHQLFCGVNNSLTLKKRYKDLIKIYHPDNLAGNHEMVLLINKEYETLKDELNIR